MLHHLHISFRYNNRLRWVCLCQNPLTKKPPLWNTVLCEKLMVSQLIKAFIAFNWNSRFVFMFTRACLWSLSWPYESSPHPLILFTGCPFQYCLTIYIWVFQMALLLNFPTTTAHCPAYLILLHLITLIFGKGCKSRISSLCYFHQPPFTSF